MTPSRDIADRRERDYRSAETLPVRRYKIAVIATMSDDPDAHLIVVAADDTDNRVLRTVSTARGGGKRFVEVSLDARARRELIEALGGIVGPDWEE